MAILQISRIQSRRGLREDLPTLSSAELGWAIDTRELYIGNGDPGESSPMPGKNTRILTEFDLLGNGQSIFDITLQGNVLSPNLAVVIEPNLNSVIVNYSIVRDLDQRTGTMKISSNVNGTSVSYEDDYIESSNIGITLVPNVTILSGQISLLYTSTAGNTATLSTTSIEFI